MSDSGAPAAPSPLGGVGSFLDNILSSHDLRTRFERVALGAFVGILVAFLFVALVGVLWPPAAKGALDWGASIVARVKDLADTVATLCGVLISGVFGTMIRGGHDLRVAAKSGDQ